VEMEVQLPNHPMNLAFVLTSLALSSLGATHIPHETICEGLYDEPNSFELSFLSPIMHTRELNLVLKINLVDQLNYKFK